MVAHDNIVYRARHAIIDDMLLWTIRHFLLTEAEASGDSGLAEFVRGWEWFGPGVWNGDDFDLYFSDNAAREAAFLKLLDAAGARVGSFGEFVPLDYLAAKVNPPMGYYTVQQPVARLLQQLVKLKDLLATERPAG